MADHLPADVMVLILLRLPPKSVIRFGLACKSWLSLISPAQFRLMYPLSSNLSRSLVGRVSWREKKEIYSVHFNDQRFTLDTGVSVEFPFHIHRCRRINFRPIGCCNGVICLSYDRSGRDETILWNPSIRKKLTLPPPIRHHNRSRSWYSVFGFGYDKATDDYKVVRLVYYLQSVPVTRPHVQVYTVKTAIWREVEFPHDLTRFSLALNYLHVPLFFNGSAHWISYSNSRPTYHSILTFEMTSESFGEIQFPEKIAQEVETNRVLVVVEECLGVIHYASGRTSSSYEIWVMKEYKNLASWMMLYNMHYPDEDVGSALGLTDNGSLIAETGGSMRIYKQEGCYNVFGSGKKSMLSDTIIVERYQEGLGLWDVGDDVWSKS